MVLEDTPASESWFGFNIPTASKVRDLSFSSAGREGLQRLNLEGLWGEPIADNVRLYGANLIVYIISRESCNMACQLLGELSAFNILEHLE